MMVMVMVDGGDGDVVTGVVLGVIVTTIDGGGGRMCS